MTAPPEDQQQPGDHHIHKPRREVWALGLGILILLGLFGHLLSQQEASRRADRDAESRRESAPSPAVGEAQNQPAPQTATNTADTSTPMRAIYAVTHKHRLRDCHGTLTFTRDGIRFESDAAEDSFAVGRDDVAVEGDALRIRARTWRFDFHDAVNAESIFQDWKKGTLRSNAVPSRRK